MIQSDILISAYKRKAKVISTFSKYVMSDIVQRNVILTFVFSVNTCHK